MRFEIVLVVGLGPITTNRHARCPTWSPFALPNIQSIPCSGFKQDASLLRSCQKKKRSFKTHKEKEDVLITTSQG